MERSEWIVISEFLIYNWSQEENVTLANYTAAGLLRSFPSASDWSFFKSPYPNASVKNLKTGHQTKKISADMTNQVKSI